MFLALLSHASQQIAGVDSISLVISLVQTRLPPLPTAIVSSGRPRTGPGSWARPEPPDEVLTSQRRSAGGSPLGSGYIWSV
jgi:hypothetical protein